MQVEMGMKNHELVSGKLVAAIAQLGGGGAHKILMRLSKERLLAYERGKHCKIFCDISMPRYYELSSWEDVWVMSIEIQTTLFSSVLNVPFDNCGFSKNP